MKFEKEESELHNWKQVQVRTFTKWLNARLSEHNIEEIENLFECLTDGVKLILLVSKMLDKKVNFNKQPNHKIQKMENFKVLFDLISSENIYLVNIHTDDIVVKNKKLTLGLVWTLISKLNLRDLGSQDSDIKKGVLMWCRAVTTDYPGVDINDFSKSWKDGLAFNAILHKFGPDAVGNFRDLSGKSARENIESAFDIAEKRHGIKKLLDVEDLTETPRPDENSVFTYVSEYYKKFKDYVPDDLKSKKKDRMIAWLENSSIDYERRAEGFKKKSEILNVSLENLILGLKNLYKEFSDYEREYEAHGKDYISLTSLHSNINMFLNHHNLPDFTTDSPPETLRLLIKDKSMLKSEREKLNDFNDFLGHEFLEKNKRIITELSKIGNNYEESLNLLSIFKEIAKYSKIVDERINLIKDLQSEEKDLNMKVQKALNMIKEFDPLNSGKINQEDYQICCKLLGFKGNNNNDYILISEFKDEINKNIQNNYKFAKIQRKIIFKNNSEEVENLIK